MVELKKRSSKRRNIIDKSSASSIGKTKEVLNQAVADLYVAHIALHQVHWYMRGRGFLVWHQNGWVHGCSWWSIGWNQWTFDYTWGSPFSTLTEFLQNSEIEEEAGEYRNVEESLERVLDVYRYLITLFQKLWMLLMKKVMMWQTISLLVLKLNLRKRFDACSRTWQAPGL